MAHCAALMATQLGILTPALTEQKHNSQGVAGGLGMQGHREGRLGFR